jgi:hypothetical protein
MSNTCCEAHHPARHLFDSWGGCSRCICVKRCSRCLGVKRSGSLLWPQFLKILWALEGELAQEGQEAAEWRERTSKGSVITQDILVYVYTHTHTHTHLHTHMFNIYTYIACLDEELKQGTWQMTASSSNDCVHAVHITRGRQTHRADTCISLMQSLFPTENIGNPTNVK